MPQIRSWDPKEMCITLIGMPGVGKSTVGHALAYRLQWGFVDTDYCIEAVYGVPLQSIADALSKEAFLDVEAVVVGSLRVRHMVVGTGGSVVYRQRGMEHLRALGPLIHLDAPLSLIQERVARNPDRGLAINPGQTIEDLFRERQVLYSRYADHRISVATLTPQECAAAIAEALAL